MQLLLRQSGSPNGTFALVANYQDDSLSRNRILYDLSDAVGLPHAPDSRYVDFYINGFYWGSYLMCEKVEPGSLLPAMAEEDYLEEDGTLKEEFAFVLEVNPSAGDGDNWFETNGMKITIVSPAIKPESPGYDEIKEHVKEKFDRFYSATAQKMIADADATNYDQNFADMYDYATDWMLARAAWLSEQFARGVV